MKTVLQITGEAGAGKSDVCNYLAEAHDFLVVLVSDIIRSFATDRQVVLESRADYLAVHAQMKQERGNDYVASTILAHPEERICVDGIRVVNDVVRLQRASHVMSKMIALHCPPAERFLRALARQSPRDRKTYEEFLEDDARDAYNPDPERQNTHAVMAMADFHLDSSRPKELVFRDLEEIVEPLLHGRS